MAKTPTPAAVQENIKLSAVAGLEQAPYIRFSIGDWPLHLRMTYRQCNTP